MCDCMCTCEYTEAIGKLWMLFPKKYPPYFLLLVWDSQIRLDWLTSKLNDPPVLTCPGLLLCGFWGSNQLSYPSNLRTITASLDFSDISIELQNDCKISFNPTASTVQKILECGEREDVYLKRLKKISDCYPHGQLSCKVFGQMWSGEGDHGTFPITVRSSKIH